MLHFAGHFLTLLGAVTVCIATTVEWLMVQVSERVAVRVQRRRAAEAAKQAVLEAQAHEQAQFESIKQEFGVDTATVR